MRVLFQARSDIFSSPAGDTIQFNETRRWLLKLGVAVDISFEFTCSLDCYDIIHIFNATTCLNAQRYFRNAERQKKAIVISPIYWTPIIRDKGKSLIRLEILKHASAILPNSLAEKNILVNEFRLVDNIFIIPNGVNSDIYAPPDLFFEQTGIQEEFAICVGRFSRRKNQLALIEALFNDPVKLVFVGDVVDSRYFNVCDEYLKKRPDWLHIRTLDREEIFSAFSAAKTNICVSVFETPGLVNLEAGLMGCNLVSSGTGSQEEYFGNFAYICNHHDKESIRWAVFAAMANETNPHLRDYIIENYTWEIAAKKTLEAYEYVIKKQAAST